MSTLSVNNIIEKTTGAGVHIPGHVVQVVQHVFSPVTRAASGSTSFSATNISGAITPKYNNSKILVMVSTTGNNNNTDDTTCIATIYRGNTDLSGQTQGMCVVETRGARSHGAISMNYLDDPQTTNATTYSVYFRSSTGSTVEIPFSEYETATLILQEVAQ
tara:strand:+ start:7233 stop:7715 length:483 start_codon:yes stop_codon:yes gene_type:complete